jgi:hypothetical protein
MLFSASVLLLVISSLAALQSATAFPIAGPGPANQVQFSRFQLKGKTLPGCYCASDRWLHRPNWLLT